MMEQRSEMLKVIRRGSKTGLEVSSSKYILFCKYICKFNLIMGVNATFVLWWSVLFMKESEVASNFHKSLANFITKYQIHLTIDKSQTQ
jgi:hypothetical protein